MDKAQDKGANAKKNFADAFCVLARTQSVSKISVMALSKKAGYNRSTFYEHFQDIYELLEYMAQKVLERLEASIDIYVQKGQFASGFVKAFEQLHSDEAAYIETLLKPELVPFYVQRARRALRPLLTRLLGLPDTARTRSVLAYHVAAVTSVISAWIAAGRDLPSAEHAVIIEDLSKAILRHAAD
ncbi:MAG: hypothetical protein SPL30_08195 [Succinivibrio sp.]|nr:hypothetical protein [Succinivibrio sp.]